MKKVELLAPVGCSEGLNGVINAGADAVYLAGNKFGARAYAENFDNSELIDAIKLAHLFGVKVYITINTLIKENEFDELYSFLEEIAEYKPDGVIVQDLGVIKFIYEHFPKLPIHASTQMSVTGTGAVELLKRFNVSRIVTARELSLSDIVEIKKKTGIEIETFIHGAMCYSFSGMCLFSSMLGERSGNRGRCAQPCRLNYTNDSKGISETYPLSMKDMCTASEIGKLIDSGIDSFKIEGRMKKPEYACMVTAIYRKAIDNYYKTGVPSVENEDLEILNSLYIRKDRSTGYYFKYNGPEMITLESPAYTETNQELLKKIETDYLLDKPKKIIDIVCEFLPGKPMLLIGNSEKTEIRLCGPEVMKAENRPLDKAMLQKQLVKMNDTNFKVGKLEIRTEDDGFLPIGMINATRRKMIELLEAKILSTYEN